MRKINLYSYPILIYVLRLYHIFISHKYSMEMSYLFLENHCMLLSSFISRHKIYGTKFEIKRWISKAF